MVSFQRLRKPNVETTATISTISVSLQCDDDGTELKAGLGIEWALSPSLRLRGEAEYYDFDDRILMFSAGVLFRF